MTAGLRQDGVPRTEAGRNMLMWLRSLQRPGTYPIQDAILAIEAEASQLPASDALDPELMTEAIERAVGRLRLVFGPNGVPGTPVVGRAVADEYEKLRRARAGEPSEPGGGAGE